MFLQPDRDVLDPGHSNWTYSINGQIENLNGFDKVKSSYLRCILYLLLPDHWTTVPGHSVTPVVSNLTAPGSSDRSICLPFQMHLSAILKNNANENEEVEDTGRLCHPRLLVLVVDGDGHEVGIGFASLPLTPGRFVRRIVTCAKSAVTLRDKLTSAFMSGSHYNSDASFSQLFTSLEMSSQQTSSSIRIRWPHFPQVNDSYGTVNVTLNVLTSSFLMDKLPVDPIEKVIEAFKRAKAKLVQLRQDIHEQTLTQGAIDRS